MILSNLATRQTEEKQKHDGFSNESGLTAEATSERASERASSPIESGDSVAAAIQTPLPLPLHLPSFLTCRKAPIWIGPGFHDQLGDAKSYLPRDRVPGRRGS